MRAPTECAHHLSKSPNRRKGGIQHRSANGIVDEIETAAAGKKLDLFVGSHIPVDRRGAVGAQSVSLRRPVRGEHLGPKSACDLYCHMPNASSADLNQHLLPCRHVCPIDQSLPGSDHYQRQRGRLAHREIRRFACQQVSIDGRVFRKRSLHAADAAGHSIHFVAKPKPGDASAHLLDYASHVDAEDAAQGMPRVDGAPGPDLGVKRVHATGMHAHQNLAAARHRASHIRQSKWRVLAV